MDLRALSDRIAPVHEAVSSFLLPFLAAPPEPTSDRVGALARPGRSLILRDLTEKVVEYRSNNADPTGTTPTEKDFATVRLEIFGPDGEPIGETTGAGRMLYKQEHDGHFIAYFGEEIRLRDGNVIRSGGLVDDARLTAGEAAHFPAVVVAGPLRGAVGVRWFRPLVKEAHDAYESAIVVYR